MVVEMGSRPTNGERLGSNRLGSGDTMYTLPPDVDGVKLDRVVTIVETKDHHPSGMSMVGDILAVPMGGFVHFYDTRDPLDPVRLDYALPLIDSEGEPTGANAVAITKLPPLDPADPEDHGRFLLVTDTDKGAHFYFSYPDKRSFFEEDGITQVTDIFHKSVPASPAYFPEGWTEDNSEERCNEEAEQPPDPNDPWIHQAHCRRHRVFENQYVLLDKGYLEELRTEDGKTAWPFKGGGPAYSRLFQGMNFVNQADEDGNENLFLIGSANSNEWTPQTGYWGNDELYLLEVFSLVGGVDHQLLGISAPWNRLPCSYEA